MLQYGDIITVISCNFFFLYHMTLHCYLVCGVLKLPVWERVANSYLEKVVRFWCLKSCLGSSTLESQPQICMKSLQTSDRYSEALLCHRRDVSLFNSRAHHAWYKRRFRQLCQNFSLLSRLLMVHEKPALLCNDNYTSIPHLHRMSPRVHR